MQILGPHINPAQSEMLGAGPAACSVTSPPGDSHAHSSWRTTALHWRGDTLELYVSSFLVKFILTSVNNII